MTPVRSFISVCICVHLWLIASAQGAWLDANYPFRRPIEVIWDAEKSNGEDLATAEFYAAGKIDDTGRDIRVATEEGRQVGVDVLGVGPGDLVRIACALQKNTKKYYVYWGNPKPEDKRPELIYHRGVLMEMKIYPGGSINNYDQLRKTFEQAKDPIGRTVLDRPFIGNNVLGEQQQTISKLTAKLFVPIDGEYQFALNADDRGALLIDDRLITFAHGATGDIRFNGKADLKRGPHKLILYHCDVGGDWRISLGWKRPDMQKVDVIGRESFGITFHGATGALEERNKTLIADFNHSYQGESWYAERISHRYRFMAYTHKSNDAKYEWDFGDGQTASGAKVDHVYLTDGVYPVKLTIRLGPNNDTRTTKFSVRRDYERLARPQNDKVEEQSKLVAAYNLDALPANQLQRAVWMHHRAENWDAMTTAAMKLASQKKPADPDGTYAALSEAADAMNDRGGPAAVEKLWAAVPADSPIAPRALRQRAKTLMWGVADFKTAAAVLKDVPKADNSVRRLQGMALVLTGSVDEGAKILHELPEQGEPEKRAAISGAMARTIEFHIEEKDADSGDDQWDKWAGRYPADFLLGYSVVLKVRLMEVRKNPAGAAKLAEAFATAVPKSSYAPQLLDKASKLLAKSDAQRSGELKALLKQRYPEDPLAQ
jgi:hypothetical protein